MERAELVALMAASLSGSSMRFFYTKEMLIGEAAGLLVACESALPAATTPKQEDSDE